MFEFIEGIAHNMASSGSYGGNTTTAESARKVYKTVEIRERLVALCPDQYKFTFIQILFNCKCNLCLFNIFMFFIPQPTVGVGLKGLMPLCPIGSPLGEPGPLGDLFVDLGPL